MGGFYWKIQVIVDGGDRIRLWTVPLAMLFPCQIYHEKFMKSKLQGLSLLQTFSQGLARGLSNVFTESYAFENLKS